MIVVVMVVMVMMGLVVMVVVDGDSTRVLQGAGQQWTSK